MITVVIPAYNAAKTLGECLASLASQEEVPGPVEIIVVDDGSTDETAAIAAAAGARVLRQERQGQAAARNVAIQSANGDILAFTDADCVPQSNWLLEITAPLVDDNEIAASKGIYCTKQREVSARFVQLEYEEKYARLRGHTRIMFMDFYSAACRRKVLLDSNGFDERFPNSEDRELSYRLASCGYHMVFQPSAVVCHQHSSTIRSYFQKKVVNGYWTAQAVRNFPERGVEDTYTPQVMKGQIALMALIMATAAASVIFPPALILFLAAVAFFVITTLPFTRKAWGKDRTVALWSPVLLMLRALALGIGYAWGLTHPIPPIEEK